MRFAFASLVVLISAGHASAQPTAVDYWSGPPSAKRTAVDSWTGHEVRPIYPPFAGPSMTGQLNYLPVAPDRSVQCTSFVIGDFLQTSCY